MQILGSQGWWVLAVVLLIAAVVLAMRRRTKVEAEAGSTLLPGQDAGSWAMTANLPQCSACQSPMMLETNRRGQQVWACPTTDCVGRKPVTT